MNERRPHGFKRVGVRTMLAPLLLAPFVAVGLTASAFMVEAWQSSRAVAAYEVPTGAARGRLRVRVAGPVRRSTPVRSPLGTEGVGWVASVGTMVKDNRGRSSFVTLCARGDLSDLRIGGLVDEWALTFVKPDESVTLGSRSKLRDALPIVDIGEPAAPAALPAIPADIQRACGSALAGAPGALIYREAVLAAGATIEVLGCGDGQRIARCGDGGPYLLTTGTVRQLQADRTAETGILFVVGGLWNLVIMLVIGLSLSRFLVRSTPSFQERLRAR